MKVLSIDVGSAKLKYAMIDETGQMSNRKSVPFKVSGCDEFLNVLTDVYRRVANDVEGVCISMPGVMNAQTGYTYSGGRLRFIQNLPLGEILSKCFEGKKTAIENDGKCVALAELRNGVMKGISNGVVIVTGTGVSGGIIIDGKVYKGNHFVAGEFSPVITRASFATPDGFGLQRWCAASSVSKMLLRYEEQEGLAPNSIDGLAFFERVNSGEMRAIKLLRQFCNELAVWIYNLQTILDPDRFAIGGGVSCQPAYIWMLREELNAVLEMNQHPAYISIPEVVPCKFKGDAGMMGAFYHFCDLYQIPIDL